MDDLYKSFQHDVEKLQNLLARVDLFESKNKVENVIEILVHQLCHTKVGLRPDKNHFFPHFHIEYKREFSASYSIEPLKCLKGNMPRKYEKPILKWAKEKQSPLKKIWRKLINGDIVEKEWIIEILEKDK
ncbi:DUF4160 domain-containing protein [bacterium]|nr:DUF4160 domain-containing protein [bacterium]